MRNKWINVTVVVHAMLGYHEKKQTIQVKRNTCHESWVSESK